MTTTSKSGPTRIFDTPEPTKGPLTDAIASESISKQQKLKSDQPSDARATADRAIDDAEARANTPASGTRSEVAPTLPPPADPSHYDNLHAAGWTPAEIAARAVSDLESLAIAPGSLALTTGDTKQLAANGVIKGDQPNRDVTPSVTWSSDNHGIASVSTAGLVIAVSPGATVVTAANGSRTARMTVTVTAPVSAHP